VQLKKIVAHQIKGEKMGIGCAGSDPWTITVGKKKVRGSTCMDNFNMCKFLELIGVPDDVVKWKY